MQNVHVLRKIEDGLEIFELLRYGEVTIGFFIEVFFAGEKCDAKCKEEYVFHTDVFFEKMIVKAASSNISLSLFCGKK